MVILTDVEEELFEGGHLIEFIAVHLGQPVHVPVHVLVRNGMHGPHPFIKVRDLTTVGSDVPGKKELVRRGLLVKDVTAVTTVTCRQFEVWSSTQLYSFCSLQSRISVKTCVFLQTRNSKFASVVLNANLGLIAPIVPHPGSLICRK